MSKEKDLIVDKINEILATEGLFTALSIQHINFTPHQYVIGPRHIVHAGDHHGGMLGEATLKAIQCAYPKCHISYEEHKSNKVLFLQLTRDGKNDIANDELKKLTPIMQENKIEGVVMVETDEEYRIT